VTQQELRRLIVPLPLLRKLVPSALSLCRNSLNQNYKNKWPDNTFTINVMYLLPVTVALNFLPLLAMESPLRRRVRRPPKKTALVVSVQCMFGWRCPHKTHLSETNLNYQQYNLTATTTTTNQTPTKKHSCKSHRFKHARWAHIV
jgi:hypothetical protein